MNAKDTLIAARKLIEHKSNWTQNTMARDENGSRVYFESDKACAFCSLGALYRAAGAFLSRDAEWDAELALERAMDDAPVGFFNDNHTHAEVLAAFDRAIASCKEF